MIVIEWIDVGTGRVGVDAGNESGRALERRLAELDAAALALGLRTLEVHVRGAAPSMRQLVAAPRSGGSGVGTEAPPEVALEHRTSRSGPVVRYEAHFPHRLPSCAAIASWTQLVLQASLIPTAQLELVRLATYELGANAIQHGKLLRPGTGTATPGADAHPGPVQPLDRTALERIPSAAEPVVEIGLPTVEIGFEIEGGRLRGWVRDRCAPFDPLRFTSSEVADLIRQRRRRGWGLRLVQCAVESLQHTHDGNGNLVSFTKELSDVSSK